MVVWHKCENRLAENAQEERELGYGWQVCDYCHSVIYATEVQIIETGDLEEMEAPK